MNEPRRSSGRSSFIFGILCFEILCEFYLLLSNNIMEKSEIDFYQLS